MRRDRPCEERFREVIRFQLPTLPLHIALVFLCIANCLSSSDCNAPRTRQPDFAPDRPRNSVVLVRSLCWCKRRGGPVACPARECARGCTAASARQTKRRATRRHAAPPHWSGREPSLLQIGHQSGACVSVGGCAPPLRAPNCGAPSAPLKPLRPDADRLLRRSTCTRARPLVRPIDLRT